MCEIQGGQELTLIKTGVTKLW